MAGYSYHPSKVEKLWSEQSRVGQICATLADEPYQAMATWSSDAANIEVLLNLGTFGRESAS